MEATGPRSCPLPAALPAAACLLQPSRAQCSPFPRFWAQPRPTDFASNHISFVPGAQSSQSKINRGPLQPQSVSKREPGSRAQQRIASADLLPTQGRCRVSGQSGGQSSARGVDEGNNKIPGLRKSCAAGNGRGVRACGVAVTLRGRDWAVGSPGLAPRRAKGHTPWSRGK